MGIDSFPCDYCSRKINDSIDCDYCEGCGVSFCVDCRSNKNGLLYDGTHFIMCKIEECKKCEDMELECSACTENYKKRNIKDKELIEYFMKKYGYESKTQMIEEIRKYEDEKKSIETKTQKN